MLRRWGRIGALLSVAVALAGCRVHTAYDSTEDPAGQYAPIDSIDRLPGGGIAISGCDFDGDYYGMGVLAADRAGAGTMLERCQHHPNSEASIATDAAGRTYFTHLEGTPSGLVRQIISMDAAGGNRVVEYEEVSAGDFNYFRHEISTIAVTDDGHGIYFSGHPKIRGQGFGPRVVRRVTGPSSAEDVPGTVGLGYSDFVVDDDGVVWSSAASHVVVKVTPDGERTVVAGNGTGGFSGDGGPAVAAQLNGPLGVDLTPDGNLLIADTANGRIRLVGRAGGQIVTVAGGGDSTTWDEGAPALGIAIGHPTDVVADTEVEFWFVEAGDERVHYSGVPDD